MKRNKRIYYGLWLLAATVVVGATTAHAADNESDSEAFKKYGQEFKGKIARTYAESEEWYPETRKPKSGSPNVFIILLDDVGFSQLGSYGGLI